MQPEMVPSSSKMRHKSLVLLEGRDQRSASPLGVPELQHTGLAPLQVPDRTSTETSTTPGSSIRQREGHSPASHAGTPTSSSASGRIRWRSLLPDNIRHITASLAQRTVSVAPTPSRQPHHPFSHSQTNSPRPPAVMARAASHATLSELQHPRSHSSFSGVSPAVDVRRSNMSTTAHLVTRHSGLPEPHLPAPLDYTHSGIHSPRGGPQHTTGLLARIWGRRSAGADDPSSSPPHTLNHQHSRSPLASPHSVSAMHALLPHNSLETSDDFLVVTGHESGESDDESDDGEALAAAAAQVLMQSHSGLPD
mmetsp:Transcript_9753/g.20818  ORF Transcript_9753/g.20818 Transcript_9753/m.20818 type:complete len:308 (-) Transcript_9753:1144-2067(-)